MKFGNKVANAGRFLRSALGQQCWYLIFFITVRCNQRCRMCFYRDMDEEAPESLSLDEIKKIAPHFNGLYQLTLSGGEPTLRPDMPEIVAAFNQSRPIPRITLPTNGQKPELTAACAETLAKENPASNINIALSLDGIGDVHDEIRGVPGAFENYLESHRRVKSLMRTYLNLTTVTATTISSFNLEHMDEMLEFIRNRENPEEHGFMIARGVTREEEAKDIDLQTALEKIEALQKIQNQKLGRLQRTWRNVYQSNRLQTLRTKKMVDPCLAGSKLLILNHNGDLWPCEILQHAESEDFPLLESGFCFGNIRDAECDAGRLLSSAHAEEIRQYIRQKKCSCSFECALLNNFALNPLNYLRIARDFFLA